MTLNSIVIIGTGLAGYNLAKETRKINPTVPLVLITQDEGHFYSKPMLSTALSQGKTPQNLIITPVDTMRAQLNATIYTQTSVQHIDTALQQIFLQTPVGPETLTFSQLVLALGAIPRPLPLLADIHHYRINNLADYTTFMRNFEDKMPLTILGSGLVGCEFAHDFAESETPLHIITPDAYPLSAFAPPPVGEAIQQALSMRGVQWHTQTVLSNAIMHKENLALELSNGVQLNTKTLLSAIGLQANVSLAQKASLAVNSGIVVDRFLQTSHPHIYALGDCAEINGKCLQFVAPLLQSARCLAQTLCGKPTALTLPLAPIVLKLSSLPVILFPPSIHIEGQWHFEKEGLNIKGLFYDHQDVLRGYALTGTQTAARQECLQAISKALENCATAH